MHYFVVDAIVLHVTVAGLPARKVSLAVDHRAEEVIVVADIFRGIELRGTTLKQLLWKVRVELDKLIVRARVL